MFIVDNPHMKRKGLSPQKRTYRLRMSAPIITMVHKFSKTDDFGLG